MKRRLKVAKLAMVRRDEPSSVKKDANWALGSRKLLTGLLVSRL